MLELPQALEQDIINTAPDIAPSRGDYAGAVSEDMAPSWATDPAETLRERFAQTRATADRPRLQIPDWLE